MSAESSDPDARSGWLFDSSVAVQSGLRRQPLTEGNVASTRWGQQMIYDRSDPSNLRLVSTIGTYQTATGQDGGVSPDGFYGARHSIRFDDSLDVVAWLSAGVRVVDLENPSDPEEVAFFIPPSRPDPQGWWAAADGTREFPLAWGLATDGELVYVSDVNSGLWIFRVTIPVVVQGVPHPE